MFNNIKPRGLIGVCALLVTFVFFFFVAFPLQLRFGMWGLALTQLGILVIALIPMFLFKWKLRDVMPLKRVTPKQLLAVMMLIVATYIVVNMVSVATAYLFPQSTQLSADIVDFFATTPFIVSLIIISVVTGLCEEALHRGLIQHTFTKGRSELAVMLIMALIFGLFHLSPFRFLPTAIMGFVLTYVMIKTENFLVPVLYHAIHNAVAFVQSYGADTSQAVVVPLSLVGVFLILSALSPFLFYVAVGLLNEERPRKTMKYATVALTAAFLALGISAVVLQPESPRTYITNFSLTQYVNNETEPVVFGDIVIEDDGMYDLFVSINDSTHRVRAMVTVECEDGEIVWDSFWGAEFFQNSQVDLRVGVYRVIFSFETQSEEMVAVELRFSVRQL